MTDADPRDYTDRSPLVALFADPACVRVLDVFLMTGRCPLLHLDIGTKADVTVQQLLRVTSLLMDIGLIEELTLIEETTGREMTHYQLADSALATHLRDAHTQLHLHVDRLVTYQEDLPDPVDPKATP